MRETLYVESSALVAAVLQGDSAARRSLRSATHRIASALTIAEGRRALVRSLALRLVNDDDYRDAALFITDFESTCEIVSISDEILKRVEGRFPVEPVRSLDAIHLATIEQLDLPRRSVRILTRDKRIIQNAEATGYRVV